MRTVIHFVWFNSQTRAAVAAQALVVCAASSGVACSLISDGQAAPPQLGKYDELEVAPECVVLDAPVTQGSDTTAATSTNLSGQLITVIGKRHDGTGAESVQVTVSIGVCSDSAARSVSGSTCGTPVSQLSEEFWGRIELYAPEGSNCITESQQLVACHLSPDGLATFGIRPVAPVKATVGKFIPVCVAPRYDTSAEGNLERRAPINVPVSISQGVETGSMLRVIQSGTVPSQPSGKTSCDQLSTCTQALAYAYRVSLVDSDGMAEVADRTLNTFVNVIPSSDDNSPPATVNAGIGCATAQAASASVSIPAGSSMSDPFTICTYNREGTYRISAMLENQPEVKELAGSPLTTVPDIRSIIAQPVVGVSSTWNLLFARCGSNDEAPVQTSMVRLSPESVRSTSDTVEGAVQIHISQDLDAGITGTNTSVTVTLNPDAQECTLNLNNG